MPNLTFQMEGIRAERYSFEPVAQLAVNVNIVLGKVERSGQGYALSFVIKLEYNPPVASLDARGRVLISPVSEEERRELEKSLESGQPPPQLAVPIISYVLPVLSILTRELGLPPPVPLPAPPPQQQARPGAPGYV